MMNKKRVMVLVCPVDGADLGMTLSSVDTQVVALRELGDYDVTLVAPDWVNLSLSNWKDYDYIAFIMQGDTWHASHLVTSLRFLEMGASDFVYGDVSELGVDGQVLTPVNGGPAFHREALMSGNFIYMSTVVMKATCAKDQLMSKWAGPYADWEYWIRLSRRHHFFKMPGLHATHRWSPSAVGPVGADKMYSDRVRNWCRFYDAAQGPEGWLSQEEVDVLREYSRGKRVIEVGSFKGKSACAMAPDAESVLCVDTFRGEDDGQAQSDGHTTLDTFLRNTSSFSNVGYLAGTSSEVLPTLIGRKFDVAFIDGDHTKEGVEADIRNVLPLMEDDGVVLFHDYLCWNFPGVREAVDARMKVSRLVSSAAVCPMELAGPELYIVVQPFAASKETRGPNPKSPSVQWWQTALNEFQHQMSLRGTGVRIVQVGSPVDERIYPEVAPLTPTFADLSALLTDDSCVGFASCDTYLQHVAHRVGCRGTVIWSQSDPLIFGYPENSNVLLDRGKLRREQWWLWSQTEYREDAFVTPVEFASAMLEKCISVSVSA